MQRCLLLGVLFIGGCDDANVAVCFSNGLPCGVVAQPVADAGTDQTVDADVAVILDGSNSRGGAASIASYAWTQTGGVPVTLTDADQAQASFTAPGVAVQEVLTFRLTIVNSLGNADSDSTNVTVQPTAPAALAVALLDGPLRPATADPVDPATCPSATDALPADIAAAQLGLWLAARTLAIAKGLDQGDPSDWLDLVRRLVSAAAPPPAGLAGQLESFGYQLFGSVLAERDPALQQAIADRLRDAPQLADPAGLLAGRVQLTNRRSLALGPSTDAATATARAVTELLGAVTQCVDDSAALTLTAASLRVLADAPADDAQ